MIPSSTVIGHFRSNSAFNRDGEVALFRQLANSILAHTNGVFIDETHGTVAKVEFTSPINGIEHCEISDLLLIMKDIQSRQYRATFWQAKKEKHPRWPVAISDANFDFEAQFNQWELLSQRPSIKGLSKFHPPSDLLSNATSPSIGSFGVFYERNGVIEVNYSVAEAVTSSGITKHPRMVINGHLSKYIYAHREALVRSDMDSFFEAINDFSIGSLLDPTSPPGKWLAKYIDGKCVSNNKTSFFDDDWHSDPPEEIQIGPEGGGDGISILMIEVESDLTR